MVEQEHSGSRVVDGELVRATNSVQVQRERLRCFARELNEIQGGNEHWHRVVTQSAATLSRLLHLDQLYRQILDVPGVICEFGVHWGATFATLLNLRSIHEPFNLSRTIVGFDTFDGFPAVSMADGTWNPGDFQSSPGYRSTLEEIASIHESLAVAGETRKFQLVEGDVTTTLDPWLNENRHAVIALAILDLDLYEPTKHVLERILPRCTKGSILVFDELSCPEFAGETMAVAETLGLGNIRLRRSRFATYPAWAVLE